MRNQASAIRAALTKAGYKTQQAWSAKTEAALNYPNIAGVSVDGDILLVVQLSTGEIWAKRPKDEPIRQTLAAISGPVADATDLVDGDTVHRVRLKDGSDLLITAVDGGRFEARIRLATGVEARLEVFDTLAAAENEMVRLLFLDGDG